MLLVRCGPARKFSVWSVAQLRERSERMMEAEKERSDGKESANQRFKENTRDRHKYGTAFAEYRDYLHSRSGGERSRGIVSIRLPEKGFADDRCVLYVFRCAVYFAEHEQPEAEKLKWWYWKDRVYPEREEQG